MTDKAIDIFRRMVEQHSEVFYDGPRYNHYQLEKLHAEGKEIPDHLLPGRFIFSLKAEDREILTKLTSDEVSKERIAWLYYLPENNK